MKLSALVTHGWKSRPTHVEGLADLEGLANLVRGLRVGAQVAVFDGPELVAVLTVSAQIRRGAERISEAAWEQWVGWTKKGAV